MKTQQRIYLYIIIIVCVLTIIYSCKKSGEEENKLTTVSINLDWVAGPEHAFLYYGDKLNFFKEEGIQLNILQGNTFGSTASGNAVGAKSVDFALCSGETALKLRCGEKPLNLISLGVFYPNTPTVIYSLSKKGINSIEDLYGKRLGVLKSSSAYQVYTYYMKNHKLDVSKITEVPLTGNIEEVINPLSQIDAAVHFGFQHPLQLKLRNISTSEISLADAKNKIYGQSLIAHLDLLETNKNLVKRMVKAVQRSYLATINNPEEALKAFLEKHTFDDYNYGIAKLNWINDFVKKGVEDNYPIGYQTKAGWLATHKYLNEFGVLKRDINIESFYSNEYLSVEYIINKTTGKSDGK